jgi:hypothetical protein
MKRKYCLLKCIRQRAGTFETRYKEHYRQSDVMMCSSGYSSRILNIGHIYGTVADIMDVIKTEKKGKYFNTF